MIADHGRVRSLLEDLIRIDSVNPSIDACAAGEGELAAFVAAEARSIGLETELDEALPGRPNVIATLDPPGAVRELLIEVHLDTVAVAGSALEPRFESGRVHGRGACDVKGGLAAVLHALELLQASDDLRTRVVLLAAVDEEVGFAGVSHHVTTHPATADAAVVVEPTGLAVVVAHRGCVRLVLETSGRAAHTSRPDLGRNAIVDMMAVLEHLRTWNERRNAGRRHPFCDGSLLTVSGIAGGSGVNVVPDHCTATLDFRTVPDEDPAAVLREIEGVLARSAGDGIAAGVQEVLLLDWGLDTAPDHPVVLAASSALTARGRAVSVEGAPYGTDASKISRGAGVPAIVLGPGDIAQAHTDDEWIAIDEVADAALIYAQLALDLGRGPA